MIPLVVNIKNFLSYGPEIQTIDFQPYSLICLSGRNGHGKSALLDAITWAIWGHARKIATSTRPDQGLLRLGASEMMVILEFLCNGTHYKIRREFVMSGTKSQTLLEFVILKDDANSVALTGKTIKETQNTILSTLGLDYDAFINSTFLRQGQSNEFSKKSPRERKELLSSILGLNHYEQVRKLALERIRLATTARQQAQTYSGKIAQELAQLTTAGQRVAAIEKTLQHLKHELAELTKHHKQSLVLWDNAKLAEQKIIQVQARYNDLLSEQHNAREQITVLVNKWRAVHAHSLTTSRESTNRVLEELRSELSALEDTLRQQEPVQQDILRTEHTLKALHARIEQERNTIIQSHQHTLHAAHARKIVLHERIQELQNEAINLENQQKLFVSNIETINTQYKVYEPLKNEYDSVYKHYTKRVLWYNRYLDRIAHTHQNASNTLSEQCSWCEQDLNPDASIIVYTKQSSIKRTVDRINQTIVQLKTLIEEDKIRLCELEKQLAGAHSLVQQRAQYEYSIQNHNQYIIENHNTQKHITGEYQECLTTIAHLDQMIQSVASIESLLAQNQEYVQIKERLKVLTDQYTHIQTAFTRSGHLIKQIAEFEKNMHQTMQEQVDTHTQHERRSHIHMLCTRLKTLMHELQKYTKAIQSLQAEVANIQELEQDSQELAQVIELINTQKEALMQEYGAAQALYAKKEQIQKEHDDYLKQIAEQDSIIYQYTAIAHATGRDGIQALLIEEAIPEIEYEANTLLGKLTDNQAHITIESLRDLKRGGTRETLDIKISDALGIRPYDLFSGGEAFRIDFALRVAISKLVARRAGTSLQTLIIDEGFGSQDEDGLNHIMDVLYKIKPEFAKIIIVSHLPSMKEQFPVHFVVEKRANGSRVNVIEQD
jgi:exonuclease SbcC